MNTFAMIISTILIALSTIQAKPKNMGYYKNMDVDGVESIKPVKSLEPEYESDDDYFGTGGSGAAAVSNPAATYLEGGDFENQAQPTCQMLGCTGPIPNDGSYAMLSASIDGKACNQMFVPMNGCTDNKGYPIGMLCSICCDCAATFTAEMKKTFGYKQDIDTASLSL